MSALVLYCAPTELTPDHYVVRAPGGVIIYVRAEWHDSDVAAALDNANPFGGEIVLNSVAAP